ncbi:MAG: Ig-like domain-containing protein [Prevotella sp.]|nr:Ig-like domain-containing protein [Prevotella sp.]
MIKQLRHLCTLLLLAVASVAWGDRYELLTSISDIDESAQYVLGIDGTGFHYEGTSSWGKTALPSAQTPIYYTLTKASDGNSFTAKAEISGKTYYLQVPTSSNTFSMAEDSGTNTDIIIGTTQVNETNYAVANKTTTTRHLRINGTSGLRSYAGTTGDMAFFYKVVKTTTPEITFETTSKTIAIGETFTQTATTLNAEGYTVTYSSSNESVATVDASTGKVNGLAAGTDTITAKVTVDGTDYTGSYEITVIEVVSGLFDFTLNYGYGSGLSINADGSYITDDHTWTAGDVTLVTSGKYRWWSDGTLRVFTPDEGETTTLTLSVPDGKVITQIVITGGNDYKTLVPDGGTYADGTWTGSAQTVVFSRGSANAQVKTITVTYGEGTAKANAELSFSETTFTAELGGTNVFPTLSNPHELSVSYSSSDETVAKIDANGAVTLVAAGTTTITASFEGNDDYNADEASYTLTVVDPNAPGATAENPYTVAQARAAIDSGTGVTGVYAKGIVSKIVTAYSKQYGNISYNISEDGSETADQLQAYRGMSYNGEKFTSDDDIKVGDKVVIYGNLIKYNSTYEFDANNQLVSLERDVEKESAGISYSESTFTTILGQDGEFPTLDNPNGLDVTYSSSNEDVATINENGIVTLVTAGTTTIKATTEESDKYYAGVASYTLTVEDPALVSNVIDLRGKTEPLIFEAPLNGFIKGSGYNNYESVSLTGKDGVEYKGWSATDVMTGNQNCLQLKASTGKLVSPNVLSDMGVKIEVTASTNTGAIVIGEDTENESFTTALTETNFEVIGANSKYAIISKIVITPLTEAPKAKPELTADDMMLNIGDEESLSVVTNSDGSLTFASDDEEVAVVVEEPAGFIVRALAVGTATITVSVAETDEFEAAETTFTVTVKDPNALEAMFNFDEDYATLFPTLEGVSSNDSHAGDITEAVTAVVDSIHLTVSAADEGVESPNRIWTSSPRLRMYSGTLTVAAPAGYAITGLEFNDKIKWNADNTADTGELTSTGWTGEARSIVITIAGNTQWKYINVLYKKTTIPGDVTKDGKVTVADVEALVKILLGTATEVDNYDLEAAELDDVEGISIADLTKLVEMLLPEN